MIAKDEQLKDKRDVATKIASAMWRGLRSIQAKRAFVLHKHAVD
jgi:hypothetical protein